MKYSLKHLIKLFFIGFWFLPLWGQPKPLEKPPSQENTYLFTIIRYSRQPHIPSYILNRITQVQKIPKTEWTPQDSLYYAYKSVYQQKFSRALSIFVKLNTDTIKEQHAQALYRATLQQRGRYKELKKYNDRTLIDDSTSFYSVKDAFMDLTNAYIAYNKKNFTPDSNEVFPILHQEKMLKKINRSAPPYRNKLVKIAFAIDSAFRQFSLLHDNRDVILSQAFEEMGDFQREHLYITNAYFYYAGALHYNKNNKMVIEKYNRTIDAMTSHNYLSISFKHKFGKILKNRYNLKENIVHKKDVDSLTAGDFIPPPKKVEKKDYFPWLDTPVLIIIIITLMLVFVLLFVKTKK